MAAVMAVSLAACGSSTESTSSESSTSSENTSEASDSNSAASGTSAEGTVYKVGIVNYVDDASLNQIVANVESELDAKGTELGVTFDYADYYDNAQADQTVLAQIAANMVQNDVDLIVAVATPTALVMQSGTEDTDIPIVFAAVTDPVGAGLVESMDAPGGNITGTCDALSTETVLKLITAADPDADYVGLLYDTAQDSSTKSIQEAKDYLDSVGIKYIEKTGSTTDDVMLAATSLIQEGVDAVFTPTDNTVMTAEPSIYELFADAGIPQYCGADSFALCGAFVGYGVNYADLGVETADMVVDILVNGMDPATTAVRTFDNQIATVNTETCEKLGFDYDTIAEAFAPYSSEVKPITTAESFDE